MSSFDNQYGAFRIGELRLGLPLSCLKEVVPLRDIMPFAIQAPYIAGGIDLRGTLIPLVDLASLIGAHLEEGHDRIVVVAIYDGALVGLIADSLDGVMESLPDSRTCFELDEGPAQIITESFRDPTDGSYVNLIAPEAIIALPGMPKVRQIKSQPDSLFSQQNSSVTGHLMLMEVGELHIAIEPTAIYATILLNDITPPVIESDFYIGDTIYGGQKLPVVSSHELFGQGRRKDEEKEAFLIRYADGIIAFAVNQVVNVVPVHHKMTSEIPAGTVPNQAFISGALAASEVDDQADSSDYFLVLDPHALLVEESLSSIARLTLEHRLKHEEKAALIKSGELDESDTALADKSAMLIFNAGQMWATDIRNITEVLPLKGQINVFSEHGYAQGLVFSRGKPIPVFCTSVLTHVPPPKELTNSSSVLVIDVDGTRIGLMVTSLIGVEVALWKKDESAPMTIAGGKGGAARVENVRSVVRTQSDSGPRTVPSLDLTLIAKALIAEEIDSSGVGNSGSSGSSADLKPAAGE